MPDVLPVPAPVWLIQLLLLLTFAAHVVPMNFLLGGGLLAAFSQVRSSRDAYHARLAKRLTELMPVVIAVTVSLGIAPLLFVQVLYGQLLYSSSILMANAWFAVIPLVILGYYGAYWLRFRGGRLGSSRPILAWAVAIVFALVGFIYSNNFSLMQNPEMWVDHYFQTPAGGGLNWFDPTLYPRYLHMLLGAVAVSGVWFMILGVRRRSGDADWSNWVLRYGVKVFTLATCANILVGLWFLIALPSEITKVFMGQDRIGTAAFVAALICTVAAFGLLHVGARRRSGSVLSAGGVVLLALIMLMVVMRQQMRSAYLEPYFRVSELQADPQWGVFGIFAVTLLIGLGVLVWLISVVLRAKSTSPSAVDS
jgi:hypothetical protein